jgi:hypothetical protein
MRFVISSRSRASQMRHDDDDGIPVTVTAPSINPTAPIRSNHAFWAKSYPLGSEGDGGGSTIVSAVMMSPRFGGAVRYLTETRRRTSFSSMPGRSISIRSRVRRYLFFRWRDPYDPAGQAHRTDPAFQHGCRDGGITELRCPKPGGRNHHHKQPEADFSTSLSETNATNSGDEKRRTALPQHISGSAERMKYPPIAGGEQDRCPQANTSVIMRRYSGFTSPARRQARTQRRRNMRRISLNLGGYRCINHP